MKKWVALGFGIYLVVLVISGFGIFGERGVKR
jgi:hypothetical protein